MPLYVDKMDPAMLGDHYDLKHDTGHDPLIQARKIAQVLKPEQEMSDWLPQAVNADQGTIEHGLQFIQDKMPLSQGIPRPEINEAYHLLEWIALNIGAGAMESGAWMTWAALTLEGNRDAFGKAFPVLRRTGTLIDQPRAWHAVPFWQEIPDMTVDMHTASTHPQLVVAHGSRAMAAGLKVEHPIMDAVHFSAGRIPHIMFDEQSLTFTLDWPNLNLNDVGDPPYKVMLPQQIVAVVPSSRP